MHMKTNKEKFKKTLTVMGTPAKAQVWSVTSDQCSACLQGEYSRCHCRKEKKKTNLHKDLSQDSLDQVSVEDIKPRKHSKFTEDFLSDNEFEEAVDFEPTNRPLPPSTTDWDTIDSVLENELCDEHHECSSVEHPPLSSRIQHAGVKSMQMVFVDNDESDEESVPDVEVYYDDNMDVLKSISSSHSNLSCDTERNIESRDSGYMTCDLFDINVEKVTDSPFNDPSEMIEASSRVLTSLKIHEEHEQRRHLEIKKQKQKDFDQMTEMHLKNINELKSIRDALELQISKTNMELVNELMIRDELNSCHESLLMDADDMAKHCSRESKDNTPTRRKSINSNNSTPTRKRFWHR